MEPTRQVVRHTTAIGASGSPVVLVEMMTYLGYRWHPEYTVYGEYQDFNQEKYLIETRLSGALTRLWSAIALEEPVAPASGAAA